MVEVPEHAHVIDTRGKTILPGLSVVFFRRVEETVRTIGPALE